MKNTEVTFILNDGNVLSGELVADIDESMNILSNYYTTNGCFTVDGVSFFLEDILSHSLTCGEEVLRFDVVEGELQLIYSSMT